MQLGQPRSLPHGTHWGMPHVGARLPAAHQLAPRRRARLAAAAVEAPSSSDLASLELQAIINQQGYVAPPVQPGTAAAVFAVFDQSKKLQYVGFSRDLQASLRTVLGRRPDKAFYFKALQLPAVDQDAMMAVRAAWFEEVGGPPSGNKLALERKAWQSAVDAGAVSARAKPAAAAEKARELQAALKARGCVEEFVPDEALLLDGQVDFVQHAAGATQAASEAAAQAAASEASSSGRPVRSATAVVDGQAKQFDVEYSLMFPTKGGFMVDVKLSFDHMDSKHRIIVGKSYYERYGIQPEAAVEACLALMLHLKMPRSHEGMLGTAEFPCTYFTVSEMEQWYPQDFAAQFLAVTGAELVDSSDGFWRMNKVHDYGVKLEDSGSFGGAMLQGGLGSINSTPPTGFVR